MSATDDIVKMISNQLGREDVKAGDRLREDLGMESLDMYNLLTGITDQFQIVIEEVETFELDRVQDLCSLVDKKVEELE